MNAIEYWVELRRYDVHCYKRQPAPRPSPRPATTDGEHAIPKFALCYLQERAHTVQTSLMQLAANELIIGADKNTLARDAIE
jgi:hypothetical protein